MKKYTVLLLYPDYATSNYGQETFLHWSIAATVPGAIQGARDALRESCTDNAIEDDDIFVIAVFEGHLNDIKSINV